MILIAGVALIYFVLIWKAPVAPVVQTMAATEVAPLTTGPRVPSPAQQPSALKRPLDRTRSVLGEVTQRNGNGEF